MTIIVLESSTLHGDALECRRHFTGSSVPINGSFCPLRCPNRIAGIPDAKLDTRRMGGIMESAVDLCGRCSAKRTSSINVAYNKYG